MKSGSISLADPGIFRPCAGRLNMCLSILDFNHKIAQASEALKAKRCFMECKTSTQHFYDEQVWALNEAHAGSVKGVFRPWAERLDMSLPTLDSNEDDPELLIHVPFNGSVKIKAITIIGGSDGMAPAVMRAYTNREDLDFSTAAELPPVQQWDLQENLNGSIEYPTQVPKFSGVHCIDLHIPTNFGANSTKIHFIGFKGEFTEGKREAVIAVYEAKPLISDHKVANGMGPLHDIS